MVRRVDRVALVVCDSFGVVGAPDAAAYGDAGSNTLGHVAAAAGGLRAPNLAALGLGCLTDIDGVPCAAAAPGAASGRLTERSAGKDTTTGHWEITGIVLDRPFPTYPHGFPPDVIEPLERSSPGRLPERPDPIRAPRTDETSPCRRHRRPSSTSSSGLGSPSMGSVRSATSLWAGGSPTIGTPDRTTMAWTSRSITSAGR